MSVKLETGQLEAIVKRASHLHHKLVMQSRVDEELVARGFSALEAALEFDESVCGPGSHRRFLEFSRNEACRADTLALFRKLEAKLSKLSKNTGSLDKTWVEKVLGHPMLVCPLKMELLRRFFPHVFERINDERVAALASAREVERKSICTLTGASSPIPLSDLDTVSLRKRLFSDIFLDAFGQLGFMEAARRRGVPVLRKRPVEKLEIVVEPDLHVIERHASPVLELLCYLKPSTPSHRKPLLYFQPGATSYAFNLYRHYRTNHELEASLRAYATMYELDVAPVETVFNEFS